MNPYYMYSYICSDKARLYYILPRDVRVCDHSEVLHDEAKEDKVIGVALQTNDKQPENW